MLIKTACDRGRGDAAALARLQGELALSQQALAAVQQRQADYEGNLIKAQTDTRESQRRGARSEHDAKMLRAALRCGFGPHPGRKFTCACMRALAGSLIGIKS